MINTVIYLIRHSEKFDKSLINDYQTTQDNIIKEEKVILSIEGEKKAKILSEEKELQNMDVVYTSNCVRKLQTSKYLIAKQKLKVNIDERFDERRIGIPNDKDYPNWYILQYTDVNFKTIGGESLLDVRNRFNEAFEEVAKKHKGKRIAIFTHGNAIKFFLLKWCKLESVISSNIVKISYNNKLILNKELNAPDVFKLTLNNELEPINIEHIKFNDLN